jgi:hypothetical protein
LHQRPLFLCFDTDRSQLRKIDQYAIVADGIAGDVVAAAAYGIGSVD